MAKYRKRPVVIEAIPIANILKQAKYTWSELPIWVKNAYEDGNLLFLNTTIEILTLEGRMIGLNSDYLIQGIHGEIYPCKNDIFEKTYELVEEN